MAATLTAWLLTVALHGGVLLTIAWVVDRVFSRSMDRLHGGAWRESLWRVALLGGVFTATLQIASGLPSLAGRWQVVPGAATAERSPATPGRNASDPAAAAGVARSPGPAESAQASVAAPRVEAAEGANVARGEDIAAAPASGAFGVRWTTWLVCAWIAGIFVALVRIARGFAALRRALDAAKPVCDADMQQDVLALAKFAGARAPQLFSLEPLASPLATAGARILLPVWATATLDRGQLRAMIAHELAHVARHDPQWKTVIAFWLALFWFLPFSRSAQRRLDEIAELACDAFAATAVGNGRDLAECLTACAERYRGGPEFTLAAAMAARESSFIQRIERLLEGIPMKPASPTRNYLHRALALCTLLASAVCLPGIGLAPGAVYAAADVKPAQKRHAHGESSISIHSDDASETTSISLSNDGHAFSAKIDGKITFNDEENDVAALSAGGKAKFAETSDGVTQRVEISEASGKISRRYFVDNDEHAWDDSARGWLAKLILEVERSGVGAEAREKRLYAAAGPKRVLDEIEQIPNDYARSVYLKLLIAHGRLGVADLDRALRVAGAAQTDYERRQGLQAIFTTQILEPAQQLTFLRQALHFETDYERAELLVEVVPSLVDRDDVRQAWLDAALGVQADYERRRVFTAMLDRPGLNDAQLGSVIKASNSIGSDYDRRELLVAAIRRAHDVESLAPLYASSVQSLGSDYDRREALFALMRSGELGRVGAGAVLDAATHIDSSYERREVLVELAREIPANDAALLEHYRRAAAGLDELDRAQAEQALRL
ncbi:MAG: M56 family metallopeptidase [Rudaea sp.]